MVGHGYRHAAPARSSPCPARSAETRACAGKHCNWTSSSYGSGWMRASPSPPSNHTDSHCESSKARVVQQRRADAASHSCGRSNLPKSGNILRCPLAHFCFAVDTDALCHDPAFRHGDQFCGRTDPARRAGARLAADPVALDHGDGRARQSQRPA